MNDPKEISFVRINILENWRFWNQYRLRGDYEAAGREVIAQAEAMLNQDTETNARAAALILEGIEFRKKKQAAGQAGGKAQVQSRQAGIAPAPPEQPQKTRHTTAQKPPTLEELYDFCYENDLDAVYGREWYEMTVVDRNFKDRDGTPVKNWKKMCEAYINKKKQQHNDKENTDEL